MNKLVIFGGTAEGRRLAEYYKDKEIAVTLCVATEYGESLIEKGQNIAVRSGRMTEIQMKEFLQEQAPQAVIDATHPYAAEVTDNIKNACESLNLEYVRVVREKESDVNSDYRIFDSIDEIVRYLNTVEGNILLTTGSKELKSYSGIKDRKNRVFVRVLPLASVMSHVEELGYKGRNVICMQGPFTEEVNIAMIKMLDIKFLVTKDTGISGGLPEKISAAAKTGTQVLILGHPKEQGLTLKKCIQYINDRFCLKGICETENDEREEKKPRKVTILGMGMGSEETMTIAAEKAIETADIVIGAERLLLSGAVKGKKTHKEIISEKIADFILNHDEFDHIAAVMSGDTGFYSGASKLKNLLSERDGIEVEVIPGISSPIYFLNKINIPWQDVSMNSAHGRDCNFVATVKRNEKSFFLLGGQIKAENFIKILSENGLGYTEIFVGENLSYENEKITFGICKDMLDMKFEPLSVIFVRNEKAGDFVVTAGIADEDFVRGKVPMTKEEVRAITVSKLRLTENSVIYDIGAGTGSVALECAVQSYLGHVFAIERNEEGCALIEINKKSMGISNVTVVKGTAPEAMEELPVPTHAFIGGSSGNMKEIIEVLRNKNPNIRIVLNTVTVESFSDAVYLLNDAGYEDMDIVQVNIAKNKRAGRYNLMTANNPVCIISCGGKTAKTGGESQ